MDTICSTIIFIFIVNYTNVVKLAVLLFTLYINKNVLKSNIMRRIVFKIKSVIWMLFMPLY